MTQSQDSILERDVLLAETSGRAEGDARSGFPVEIPEWVPPDIKRHVCEFLRPAEWDATLVRLMTDPRMRDVWTHLTRRRRSDGRFLQPARGETTSNPNKQQERALLWLFLWVLDLVESRPRVLLRREVEEAKKEKLAFAGKLWAEADTLAYLEEIGESDPGRAKILGQAACVLWQLSREDWPGDIVVERDRHNRETHAVATAIAGMCIMLFGEALYKVTAALTAVALDRAVEHGQVRHWWKDQPIEPSADKGSFFGALSAVCRPRT